MPFPTLYVPSSREVGVRADLRDGKIKYIAIADLAAGAGSGATVSSSVIIATVLTGETWRVIYLAMNGLVCSAVAGSRQVARVLWDDASSIKTEGYPAGTSLIAPNTELEGLLWTPGVSVGTFGATPDRYDIGGLPDMEYYAGYNFRLWLPDGDATAGTGDNFRAGELCVRAFPQRAIPDY